MQGPSVAGNSRAWIVMPAVAARSCSSMAWTSSNAHQGAVASGRSSLGWHIPQIGICCPCQGSIAVGWPQPPDVLLTKWWIFRISPGVIVPRWCQP